ncbi:helix-turn-helix transcriptional regulator [Williamsia muralis]|uniref:Helix-turn-helix transcriptional regulator n=1 Tax=Williamsia marianensis TaxID=85044 RepID=A0ABU4F1K7_WILMA|nr:helix-turn-helix transcriptional regulator [Williamsia muralis]MDV7136881.1 helix-turn-helix transcriptional regulator [Williamsia muralis]
MSSYDAPVPSGGSVSRRVLRGFSPSALTEARTRAGLTQGELARIAGVGRTTLYQWEMGVRSPQVDVLASVARALDISLSELVSVPVDERFPGDWRVLRGLTQPQLGVAAGISTTMVGAIERGEAELSEQTARALADALSVNETELRAAYRRARNRPTGTPA